MRIDIGYEPIYIHADNGPVSYVRTVGKWEKERCFNCYRRANVLLVDAKVEYHLCNKCRLEVRWVRSKIGERIRPEIAVQVDKDSIHFVRGVSGEEHIPCVVCRKDAAILYADDRWEFPLCTSHVENVCFVWDGKAALKP